MAGERYVEITKDEMEKFIKNSYRPYRPKPGRVGDMLTYTLRLGPNVGLKIHTSVTIGRTEARGLGDESIEVFLVSLKLAGRREYLMTRATLKSKGIVLVMRTRNWRSALDDRVDKLIDIYEENEEYWEQRAAAQGDKEVPSGPSPSQLKFIEVLVDKIWQRRLQSRIHWADYGLDGSSKPTNFSSLTPGRDGKASSFIEHAKAVLEDEEVKNDRDRELNEERGQDRSQQQTALEPAPAGTTATFLKLRDGSWGLRGKNLVEGTWVTVTRKDGAQKKIPVGQVVWTNSDGTNVARIKEQQQRRYAGDADEDMEMGEPSNVDLYGGVSQ